MAGGSSQIDFTAADPDVYILPIPFPGLTAPTGRGDGNTVIDGAWHTNPNTLVEDNVESLTPDELALGQIVPFETKVTVDGSVAPENGVITLVANWATLTTSNRDFGYDSTQGVIAAFIDTGDGGHMDPGADATVQSFSWSVINPGTNNEQIEGVFVIEGLDDGDMVVLESWLVLDDTIPGNATGNVQSEFMSANTGNTVGGGDNINIGNMTIPLNQVGQFFTADVDVGVAKTDSPDPVANPGDALTYTVTVDNAGPSIANDVIVVDTLDPNVTFVSASDGGVFSDGGTPLDPSDDTVTWDLGALAPGDSIDLTLNVTVNNDAPIGTDVLCNDVVVTTMSDDTNSTNDMATEKTSVECFLTGTYILTEQGETLVENLKIGDIVQTAEGELVSVKWIGRQTVEPGKVKNPLRAYPILIKAGALGDNLPHRDLYVSPDHSMFIDGLLINAGALVNDISIIKTEPTENFTFYHVELENHCLLIAEGAAAESYLPQKENRDEYDNAVEYKELYPHGSNLMLWPMDYPRVSSWNKVPRFVSKKLIKIAHQLTAQTLELTA